MKLFRIAIPAVRIDHSRDFYERVLGFEADATVPSRLYFHCDDVILVLIDWSAQRKRPFLALPDNIYFATDELDAVYRRAADAGAREMSPIETQTWGERSFYCLDPDGNPLCFVDETHCSSAAGLRGHRKERSPGLFQKWAEACITRTRSLLPAGGSR